MGTNGQISFRQSSTDIVGKSNTTPGKMNQDLSYVVPNDLTPRSN